MVEGTQRPMGELFGFIPVQADGQLYDSYEADCAQAMVKLRDAVDNCPACILSVLRQSNVAHICEFDFKHEMKSLWSEINAEKNQYGYGY